MFCQFSSKLQLFNLWKYDYDDDDDDDDDDGDDDDDAPGSKISLFQR